MLLTEYIPFKVDRQIAEAAIRDNRSLIVEGVIQRGTAKKLRDLKLNSAGQTATTNNNTDTWFIGFTSNLLVGVYVGMDSKK